MRSYALLFTVLAAALALSSCAIGNGVLSTESRSVGAFDSIRVEGAGKLLVHEGAQNVQITADSNIIPYITTSVSGTTLVIGFQPFVSVIMDTTSLEYDITVPSLTGVAVSGACDSVIDAFAYDSMKVEVSGAGAMSLSGSANTLTANLSGAGSIAASALTAQAATVTISGLGSASLRVVNTLNATLSGVGNLSYWGNPTVVSDTSGLGKVTHAGD